MTRETIRPSGVVNSPNYAHAIKKSGTPVFISGQIALDADGNLVGEGDAAAQADRAFHNLKLVVEACGGSLADVVKLSIFTTDLAFRPAIGAARGRYFPAGEMPGSTFVVVSSLAESRFLVEVEAVAVID
jgi:enamine deaminase RidA (YjgF/YER057c/UK114 family)